MKDMFWITNKQELNKLLGEAVIKNDFTKVNEFLDKFPESTRASILLTNI